MCLTNNTLDEIKIEYEKYEFLHKHIFQILSLIINKTNSQTSELINYLIKNTTNFKTN